MSKRRSKKKARPQSAGWSAAVQRLLRPEHVTRISDNQVQITLPPCPDFDIDEDETVNVWVPAAALVNSTEPIYAGSFTIRADSYVQRIDAAITGLEDERKALPEDAKLPNFLLTFFTCEILAKAIVSYCKNKGKNTKTLVGKWTTEDIERALRELNIPFEGSKVRKLFATQPALAREMSARSLRDNIVHRMKTPHREAVRNRYGEIMSTMTEYVAAIKLWRDRLSESEDSNDSSKGV